MKKLLTLIAIALAVVVSSCSKFDDSAIWDKLNEQEQTLNDHEKRIAALEELCKQMNTNINALQTLVEALEKRDYITNVSPVREDGVVVGYTISFASSDTITIYNGKDGSDGTGGYTPQIGIKKDADGLYYWTLDGEWYLMITATRLRQLVRMARMARMVQMVLTVAMVKMERMALMDVTELMGLLHA